MRVLFTAAPVPSHVHVQLPIALALRDRGHEVAVATGPNVASRIEQVGIRAFVAGPPPTPRTPPPADPGERLRWAWTEYFVGPPAGERLTDVMRHCERWRPDLIVRESTEFAGCIAAESLGLPHAAVQTGNMAATWHLPRELRAAPLDELRASVGLPPDPDLAMLHRYLLLVPVPRSFHDPSIPLPPTAHFLRPLTFDRTGDEGLPAWLGTLPPRPTVYMTLGTVYNARVDLFALAIEALRDEPVNLIITVGRNQDPAQFGPQPGHTRIERYIPHSLLLPRCDAMINCGGLNSLPTAFEHALPLVLLPLGADHPFNAARCEALGLARVLDPRTATAADIREAVRTILTDPGYRAHAGQVQQELTAMPGPDRACDLLERLATDKAPIHHGIDIVGPPPDAHRTEGAVT